MPAVQGNRRVEPGNDPESASHEQPQDENEEQPHPAPPATGGVKKDGELGGVRGDVPGNRVPTLTRERAIHGAGRSASSRPRQKESHPGGHWGRAAFPSSAPYTVVYPAGWDVNRCAVPCRLRIWQRRRTVR